MGAILAKFRKEKSTTAVLEGLEEKIKQIEKYTLNTQEQKRRIVGNFLAISIGIYVIAFIVFYFVYFPPTWRERMIYSVPLLLFPFVIILLRRVFSWYFERKLNKNSVELSALRAEKKKILEQVMDKETYKVAVNLLARFGEKNNGHKYAMTPRITNTGNAPVPRLSIGPSPRTSTTTASLPDIRLRSTMTASTQSTPHLAPGYRSPQAPLAVANAGQALVPRSLALTPQRRPGSGLELARRSTPFPIVNQQNKGVLERIVDVLIGDGPQDRFAMICKDCFAHNGMALKEDFDYTTFRCAFCNALNPSRKARPIAPRLPEQYSTPSAAKRSSDTPSSSSSSTDIDSDEEKRSSERTPVHAPHVELTEATRTVTPTLSAVPVEQPPGDGPTVKSIYAETSSEQLPITPVKTNEEIAKMEALQAAAEAEELNRLQERFANIYTSAEPELEANAEEPEEETLQSYEKLQHELEQEIQEQEEPPAVELSSDETKKSK